MDHPNCRKYKIFLTIHQVQFFQAQSRTAYNVICWFIYLFVYISIRLEDLLYSYPSCLYITLMFFFCGQYITLMSKEKNLHFGCTFPSWKLCLVFGGVDNHFDEWVQCKRCKENCIGTNFMCVYVKFQPNLIAMSYTYTSKQKESQSISLGMTKLLINLNLKRYILFPFPLHHFLRKKYQQIIFEIWH